VRSITSTYNASLPPGDVSQGDGFVAARMEQRLGSLEHAGFGIADFNRLGWRFHPTNILVGFD
jgi:hypothetical protein